VRIEGTRVVPSGKVRAFADSKHIRRVLFAVPGVTADDRHFSVGG
jgi:hypothetical protein